MMEKLGISLFFGYCHVAYRLWWGWVEYPRCHVAGCD